MQRETTDLTPCAPIARTLLAGPTLEVAEQLIGAHLVVDGAIEVELTEVEAYRGVDDPASHAARGPSPRSRIMFGQAGHLYVYRSYGIHHCANVVTEQDGVAGAVLLRAAVLLRGLAEVRRRRGDTVPEARLLSGPGNLCSGLGITLADLGTDLTRAGERVVLFPRRTAPPIARGPRVGISRAVESPFRLSHAAHPTVSRPRNE